MPDTNLYACKFLIIIVLLANIVFGADAQTVKPAVGFPDEVMAWTVSTLEPWPAGRYKSLQEAMIDNQIFIPLVFSGSKIPETMGYKFTRDSIKVFNPFPSPYAWRSKRMRNRFSYFILQMELDALAHRQVMLKDPRNFRYSFRQLPKKTVKSATIDKSKDTVKVAIATPIVKPEKADAVIKFIPDRRYWKSSAQLDLKFNQNKSSKNWSSGEIDNLNFVSNLVINYNYSRGKFSVDNNLNVQLNLQNSPKDTLRSYTVTTDLFKYSGLFKLVAVGRWSYSFNPTFTSQMTRRYKVNTMDRTSSFLTPYTATAGLGMTYTATPKFKNPNQALTVNATINALNWTFNAGRDRELYPTIKRTYGSNINIFANPIKVSKSVSGWSRLIYDTNYEYILITSESQITLVLTRYISALMSLTVKYDDRVKKTEENKSLIQVNELLSFGFVYKW